MCHMSILSPPPSPFPTCTPNPFHLVTKKGMFVECSCQKYYTKYFLFIYYLLVSGAFMNVVKFMAGIRMFIFIVFFVFIIIIHAFFLSVALFLCVSLFLPSLIMSYSYSFPFSPSALSFSSGFRVVHSIAHTSCCWCWSLLSLVTRCQRYFSPCFQRPHVPFPPTPSVLYGDTECSFFFSDFHSVL